LLQWTLDINGVENFVYMNTEYRIQYMNKEYSPKGDDEHPRPFHMGVPHLGLYL